ncbi:MAG: hypothetical protein PHC91_11535, partial [Eubacteriales bacterium]|nr:hypothetical protein [Eubacteriales bacterium]
KIKNLLASETITHSFIDCIEYYNEAVPNSIYTQQGTCTPQYYRKYTIMGQDMYTLPEYLEKMEMSGFIRGENMVEDSHSQNPNLQYVVKMAGSDRAHWIFTISDDELAKLLEEEQSVTILYDSEGNQLYPVQKIPDSIMEQIDKTLMKQLGSDLGKEYCKIFSMAEDESLQLVRVIHSNHLFLETNQFRIVFLLIVMLLLIL